MLATEPTENTEDDDGKAGILDREGGNGADGTFDGVGICGGVGKGKMRGSVRGGRKPMGPDGLSFTSHIGSLCARVQ